MRDHSKGFHGVAGTEVKDANGKVAGHEEVACNSCGKEFPADVELNPEHAKQAKAK